MDYFSFILYRALAGILALLPLPVSFSLGRILGWLAFYLAIPYRRLVLHNLTIAFAGEKSPAEIRRLARDHFVTLGANLLSSAKVATMSLEAINARVQIENLDALSAAAAPGKGVIIAVSHLGNWELLAQLIPPALPGRAAGAIYQALGNEHFDRHVKEVRARAGLIPFDRRNGFSDPMKHVRGGGILGILVDQHAGDGGIWTPFFGRLASTSPLAATMTLRTGAPLMAIAVYTTGIARWRFVFSDVLPRDTTDPGLLTAGINAVLEKQIRVSPADWFWVHRRWKTPRPDFLLALYKRGVVFPTEFPAASLKPFRILIRSTNWLGDAVMSAPALRAIKAGRPDVHLTILTPAKLADFWKTLPEIDAIIPIEPSDTLFTVAKKIRSPFDVALIFPNSVRSGLEAFLAGIPRRVGYRRPWRGPLINQIVPDPKPAPLTHEVHHYLAMASNAGAIVSPSLIEHPKAPPRTTPLIIGLVPGAEYGPAKRWPAENFAAAAKQIREQTGAQWRIFGVESDRPFAEVIATALENQCENLVGKTTLAELIAQLRECHLLVTNDTGSMHLAAHLGVPVLAIFGSTEDRLTGPLGSSSRVLRHHVVCSPCFLRECPFDFRCMHSITVQEAVDAIASMIN